MKSSKSRKKQRRKASDSSKSSKASKIATSSTAPDPSGKPKSGHADPFYVAFYILSLFLCFVLFRGLADNYLFNDDFVWLAKARYEMTPENVLGYRVIGFFRPIINLSFFAMERVAPGNLALYYYGNILLHFVNSMLVFHLALNLVRDRTIAAATAVLFVATSAHCAAVFWISARTTLICTLLLLSALLVLIRPPWNRTRLTVSLVLYGLALLTKETAVVGAPLVALLLIFYKGKERPSLNTKVLLWFVGVTVVYFVARGLVIGRFVQPNWGPGVHAVRNIAGGGLYQLMPFSIDWLLAWSRELFGVGMPFLRDALLKTTDPVFPELLVVPLIAVMVLVTWFTRRHRVMLFAIFWMLICVVPMAFLRFRFLTMDSFAHNRYYYLASVGGCLAIMLVLSVLWEHPRIKRYGTVLAALVLAVMLVSESHRVKVMEKKWHEATYVFRGSLMKVISVLDRIDAYDRCVVNWTPFRYTYFKHGVELERPRWELVKVEGGKEEAAQYEPCVFLDFQQDGQVYRASAYALGEPSSSADAP